MEGRDRVGEIRRTQPVLIIGWLPGDTFDRRGWRHQCGLAPVGASVLRGAIETGFIARRIICTIQETETVRRGQRFGMICFGSRLDVYLPADSTIRVQKGDTVKAGFSVLGELT